MPFNDMVEVLRDREHRWLNLSVLLFMVLLPFNAFGLESLDIDVLAGPDFKTKFTKIALLAVVPCGASALIRNHIRIRRAPLLYGLLGLQAVASFASMINFPDPVTQPDPRSWPLRDRPRQRAREGV